jgi:hypothetical protein
VAERDLTLAEVAELRQLTPRQLRDFVRRHQVPILTTGKAIRFDRVALAALEEALRRPRMNPARVPEPTPTPPAPAERPQSPMSPPPSRPLKKRDRFGAISGFVYFVQSGEDGPIKIGFAEDVARRVRELQTAHAARLRILAFIRGSMTTERQLHWQFRAIRISGEWYSPGPELLAYIAELVDA